MARISLLSILISKRTKCFIRLQPAYHGIAFVADLLSYNVMDEFKCIHFTIIKFLSRKAIFSRNHKNLLNDREIGRNMNVVGGAFGMVEAFPDFQFSSHSKHMVTFYMTGANLKCVDII